WGGGVDNTVTLTRSVNEAPGGGNPVVGKGRAGVREPEGREGASQRPEERRIQRHERAQPESDRFLAPQGQSNRSGRRDRSRRRAPRALGVARRGISGQMAE